MPRWVARVAFAAWALLILDMTLRWYPERNPPVNLVPFASVRDDLRRWNRHAVVNLVGNVVVFVPLGALYPLVRSRPTSARDVLLFALTFSVSIELAQALSRRRIGDVDDVMLNVAGALLGYALAAYARGRGSRDEGRGPRARV